MPSHYMMKTMKHKFKAGTPVQAIILNGQKVTGEVVEVIYDDYVGKVYLIRVYDPHAMYGYEFAKGPKVSLL